MPTMGMVNKKGPSATGELPQQKQLQMMAKQMDTDFMACSFSRDLMMETLMSHLRFPTSFRWGTGESNYQATEH